jgi:uncharacterized protein with HEPN domain
VKELTPENLDNMSVTEFEEYLPDLFEAGGGSISKDPRFTKFFEANPDCLALVRDLEAIGEQARSLFEPVHEPSDNVWSNIASKLKDEPQPASEGLAEPEGILGEASA